MDERCKLIQNLKLPSRKEDIGTSYINKLVDKGQRKRIEEHSKKKVIFDDNASVVQHILDLNLVFDGKKLFSVNEKLLFEQDFPELKFKISPFLLNERLFEDKLKLILKKRCVLHLMNPKDKFGIKLRKNIDKFKELFPDLSKKIVSPDCLERIFEKLVFEYVESKFLN